MKVAQNHSSSEQGRAMTRWIRLMAAGMLVFAGGASAEESSVAAPKGALMLVETIADGVQIYACEAKDQSYAWVFKAPEATLFDKAGRQIGTHFAGPSWKASDGSLVVGEVAGRADAPDGVSIPWLLLRAKSHDGSGAFAKAAFIRRAETKGGAAPKSTCDAGHAGEEARMRYSAVYQFFAAAD
jgi:hypothetical protein